MHSSNLSDPHREVPVRMRLHVVYKHSSRAVHWLDCIILIVNLERVHVFLVVFPMTRCFPKSPVQYYRRLDFNIVPSFVDFPPIIEEQILEYRTLRQEERETRSLFHHGEQFKFLSQFPVVSSLRLFNSLEVFFKKFFLGERRRINSLKHFIFLVASPIRSSNAHDLYCFHLLCGWQMRSCAKVHPTRHAIERNLRILRQIVYQFNLVFFAFFFHEFYGFSSRQFEPFKLLVLFDYLHHFIFDFLEILSNKNMVRFKVIIETVLYGGSYCKHCSRVKLLNSLCQYVRSGMPEYILSFRRIECEKIQFSILVKLTVHIYGLPVEFGCKSFFGEPSAYLFCDFIWRRPFSNLYFFSVLQHDVNVFHKISSFIFKK